MLSLILLIAAAVCFGLAALAVPFAGRVNLVALGLLAWLLADLLPRAV